MAKQKQYTYKNTSALPQTIPGVGYCKAGGTITTVAELNNPIFKLVTTHDVTLPDPKKVEDPGSQIPRTSTVDSNTEASVPTTPEPALRKPEQERRNALNAGRERT